MSDASSPPREHRFASTGELQAALSDEIAGRLASRIAQSGRAGWVATGGSTPGPLYDRLSGADLPWDKVEVTLTDERWVPVDDAGSNEALVRKRLLTGRAAGAKLVGLKTPAAEPAGAVAAVDEALAAMPRPFEVTVLGMGDDGHIASLFPHAPELANARGSAHFVCPVTREGAAGAAARLSLTLRALLDTRLIIILIQGAEKLDVYRRALTPGDVTDLPVRLVLQQSQVPVQLWWAP